MNRSSHSFENCCIIRNVVRLCKSINQDFKDSCCFHLLHHSITQLIYIFVRRNNFRSFSVPLLAHHRLHQIISFAATVTTRYKSTHNTHENRPTRLKLINLNDTTHKTVTRHASKYQLNGQQSAHVTCFIHVKKCRLRHWNSKFFLI